MLCITLILFAIISCGAREISDDSKAGDFNVTTVLLDSLPSDVDPRIIGGSPTTISNFGFVVQILENGQFVCAGSILTIRHILSAAHCFYDQTGRPLSPSQFSIRAEATHLHEVGQVYGVSTIVAHSLYNHATFDNDIAIMVLSSDLRLTFYSRRAIIPRQGASVFDTMLVVAVGWGRTVADVAQWSNVLNQVSIRIVNWDTCRERYFVNNVGIITDNMICAGLLDAGEAGTCQGDSGGPLIANGVVVGITSWRAACGNSYFPGVYVQVSRYTTWIETTVQRYNGSSKSQAGIVALLIPLIFVIIGV